MNDQALSALNFFLPTAPPGQQYAYEQITFPSLLAVFPLVFLCTILPLFCVLIVAFLQGGELEGYGFFYKDEDF